MDIVVGQGQQRIRCISHCRRFTLIGATTRAGHFLQPLHDRFGIVEHMEYYDEASLAEIVKRSENVFDSEIKERAALEIALRSWTPRIANRLLKRVRDFSSSIRRRHDFKRIRSKPLKVLRVDAKGLDHIDRKLLTAMIDLYDGGPVGTLEPLRRTFQKMRRQLKICMNRIYCKLIFKTDITRTCGDA